MFEKKVQMYITDNEQAILAAALIDMKNELHQQHMIIQILIGQVTIMEHIMEYAIFAITLIA